jgi:hypothetical protein
VKEFRSALGRWRPPEEACFWVEVPGSERLTSDVPSVHEFVWIAPVRRRADHGNQFPLFLFRVAQVLEIRASLKLH